jgi:hypothetical protein
VERRRGRGREMEIGLYVWKDIEAHTVICVLVVAFTQGVWANFTYTV